MTTQVLTVGHSNHPLEEFLEMLEVNGVELIGDVRSVVGSRRNPQFGRDELPRSLEAAGIGYRLLEDLGGRRYTRVGEPTVNGAWRNHSFQSYADYMQTEAFAGGVDELIGLAEEWRVAIMCAEAVPWRCHRSLIGDALVVRGVEVLDIMSRTSNRPHTLTSFARVEGQRVWYPPEEEPAS